MLNFYRLFNRFFLFSMILPLFAGCYSFNTVSLNPFQRQSHKLKKFVLYSDGPVSSRSCLGGGGNAAESTFLLLPIQGTIVNGSSYQRNNTSAAKIKKILKAAQRDGKIQGIFLKIDSPGGSVTESDLIFKMIARYAKKHKLPVYSHIDSIGASGSYYIAMSSEYINANPTALVGSIGVIMRSFNARGLMKKLGIKERSIMSGKNKNAFSPFQDLKPEQREHYQKQIMKVHDRFVRIILKSRGKRISENELRKIADGRVFGAKRARDLHLIDSVLYIEDFIKMIRMKMKASSIQIISYFPEESHYETIYDVSSQLPRNMNEIILQLLGNHRSGLFYLWEH